MRANQTLSKEELDAVHQAIARLRADVMGVVFGLVGGTVLFLATIWLVISGPAEGETVIGPNLGLLNHYFPGYEVSVLGSIIGFFYGALTGALVGWIIAFVYNTVADKRQNK